MKLKEILAKYFEGVKLNADALSELARKIAARVDIQSALEDLLRNHAGAKLLGILSPNPHEPPALALALGEGHFPFGCRSASAR